MTREEVDRYLQRHPRCSVCGARAVDVHHKIPKSMKKKGKLPPGFCVDDPTNLVPVCRACHEKYNCARGPGQMPYMGCDEFKNRALAKRVAWIMTQNPAYRAMLPDYAIAAYDRWQDAS